MRPPARQRHTGECTGGRSGSECVRWTVLLLVTSALVTACNSGAQMSSDIAERTTSQPKASTTDDPAPVPSAAPISTVFEEYPDLAVREHRRAMQAPRPVEGSAMPPKHLNEEWFPNALVDRTEIVPGGPPPDGIRSIDDPVFAPIDEVDDLESNEAVLVFEHGDDTRIYPIRIMIWHEIVNDVVGGAPITVTYCPLCNSAIAFVRTVKDRVLDFGTSGHLYRSGMVMYDRQTESLWTHFDGLAVVGAAIGTQLERLPIATVSWSQATEAHPDAWVLRSDPDDPKPYGTNRYAGYDQRDQPLPGWFTTDIPEPVPPMTRVVGIRTGEGELAIPTDLLAERGVVTSSISNQEFAVFFERGTASPLQRRDVADGDDIGSSGVFDTQVDGRRLTFRSESGVVTDLETRSVWNIRGRAIVGPLVGIELGELEHLDTFWFAWVANHPDTAVVVPDTD